LEEWFTAFAAESDRLDMQEFDDLTILTCPRIRGEFEGVPVLRPAPINSDEDDPQDVLSLILAAPDATTLVVVIGRDEELHRAITPIQNPGSALSGMAEIALSMSMLPETTHLAMLFNLRQCLDVAARQRSLYWLSDYVRTFEESPPLVIGADWQDRCWKFRSPPRSH
jgi:hypothetical protein